MTFDFQSECGAGTLARGEANVISLRLIMIGFAQRVTQPVEALKIAFLCILAAVFYGIQRGLASVGVC